MLSIGIVGLPNVGKSTLFQALTKKQIDIQNYPFTTIDPNVGVVAVPDHRLEVLAKASNSKKIIPTAIEFIDIAGLIKGASQGEGLGNQFLANIREVDAIAHIVRVFEDKNITHVHNKIDPINDIEIIKTELELADLQTRENREGKTRLRQGFGGQGKNEDLPPLELLSDKKVIYVFNASEEQIHPVKSAEGGAKQFNGVKNGWQLSPELLKAIGTSEYVVLSANFELLLSDSAKEEKNQYLQELALKQSGLDKLITKSYKLLSLITFLTTGEDETRAWTAKAGTPISKAARAIHTDFEKLFIKAEVINWQKLLEAGGWGKAREKGVLRLVGRDYIVQEGDVVEIKI